MFVCLFCFFVVGWTRYFSRKWPTCLKSMLLKTYTKLQTIVLNYWITSILKLVGFYMFWIVSKNCSKKNYWPCTIRGGSNAGAPGARLHVWKFSRVYFENFVSITKHKLYCIQHKMFTTVFYYLFSLQKHRVYVELHQNN